MLFNPFILVVAAFEEGAEVLEHEPIELRPDADDHATENLDRHVMFRIDRSLAAGARGEEDIAVALIDHETHGDALRGCGDWRRCSAGCH
jgi:hypothetical protein